MSGKQVDFKKLEQSGGGFNGVLDPRDWSYEDAFLGGEAVLGEGKPLGRLEKILDSPLSKKENLLAQMNILACVPLHISMLNMYYSWINDDSEIKLSWPMLYVLATFYPGAGTSINEVLGLARDIGQCQDRLFSQERAFELGEAQLHNKTLVTSKMREEAKNWRIGNYTRLRDTRSEALYEALKYSSILIGVALKNWESQIIYSNGSPMNHLSLIIDITAEGHFVLWEGFRQDKIDIRILHKDSYIGVAYSFRDIPDEIKIRLKEETKKLKDENDMSIFRLIKSKYDETVEDKKVYLLNTDGKKCWIYPEVSFEQVFGKNAWSMIELLEREELANYPLGATIDVRREGVLEGIRMMLKALGAKK